MIYGDKPRKNLRIIYCMKAHKYIKKYHTFLDHIVDKKGEKKEIKDITLVCDFPDVSPEDLPGLPTIL